MHTKLREVREQKKLSQTRLAIRAGVAGSLISDVERRIRWPYPKLRRRLAQVLGVTEAQLCPEFGADPERQVRGGEGGSRLPKTRRTAHEMRPEGRAMGTSRKRTDKARARTRPPGARRRRP